MLLFKAVEAFDISSILMSVVQLSKATVYIKYIQQSDYNIKTI